MSSVTDAQGNAVSFSYTAAAPRSSTDSLALFIGGSGTSTLQYKTLQTVTPLTLTSLGRGTNSELYLNYTYTDAAGTAGGSGMKVISSITGSGINLQFNYSAVSCETNYKRLFLRSFTDAGCGTPVNYQFGYIGETFGSGQYNNLLPDSSGHNIDFWGYTTNKILYKASLTPSVYVNSSSSSYPRYLVAGLSSPGSNYPYTLSHTNRSADTSSVTTGSLSTISTAQGGTTTITYESNDFYDPSNGITTYGGGIRVKKVTYYDGINTAHNIVKTYSYLNASSQSSGKPLSLPQYAFTIPYGGGNTGLSLWTSATVLSAIDLSTDDHSIMYTNVTESQTGAGKIVYQYYLPGTYWDINSTPDCSGCSTAEWNPTLAYTARSNCSSSYGPIANMTYAYPFVPNLNYGFEQGLPLKMTAYNDAGSEVSETNYTYQRVYTPSVMYGFKYEDNFNGTLQTRNYNKYPIYYNTGELSATVNSKVFDSQTLTNAKSTTTTYTYGSTNHKLLTKSATINSDGSTVTSNTTYVKDFAPNNGSNANIRALYNLTQANINAPVETYQQVTRGGSTLTTGASLTLFTTDTVDSHIFTMPSKQFSMVSTAGRIFTPFSINTTNQTIAKDTGYFATANFTAYDFTGFPVTVDDANHHQSTTIVDHYASNVAATFSNAAFKEVAFSDFDSDLGVTRDQNFTINGSGGSITAYGNSHAAYGYNLLSTQSLTHTVSKSPQATKYILSVWIKASSAGTLTITYSGGGTVSDTISFSNTAKWIYHEKAIAVSALSGTFTATVTSNQQIAIDDVLLYPDVSEASTATYDLLRHSKLAQTNTNGVSAYYSYDQWGRLLYAFDQDHNIVQKNAYATPGEVADFSNISMLASNTYSTRPASFTIRGYDVCASAGTTVTWSFGDGSSNVITALSSSPAHTYASNGTYTVTATVNSPLFGSKIITLSITVTTPPIVNIPLSYNTYTNGNGDISIVTFTPTGGGTPTTFTGTQLNSAVILQGSYTVSVSLSNGQLYNAGTGKGYGSVTLTGDCNSYCSNFVSGNNYSFSINLTTCSSLNFSVAQQQSCGN